MDVHISSSVPGILTSKKNLAMGLQRLEGFSGGLAGFEDGLGLWARRQASKKMTEASKALEFGDGLGLRARRQALCLEQPGFLL